MDQETPLLNRHPLQYQKKALLVNAPTSNGGAPENSGSDSDTDLELMSVGSESSVEEELPNMQNIDPRPLAGLIVYAEVRSGTDNCENRQLAIAHQLELLGATVSQKLTKDVTHMVFKDGKQSTWEKAEKKGIYLVSPLWLDACKRANDRVSEAKYPVLCKDGSDSPVVLGRIKRLKSMQPKPLVEEVTRSMERSRKRQRTNTPLKNATPGKSNAQPQSKNKKNGSDEEDYELPEIRLPGTPLGASTESTAVTPEIGKGSRQRHIEDALTTESGTGSTKATATSALISTTGTGSTKTHTKTARLSLSGKGTSKKKPSNGASASSGKGEAVEKTVNRPQNRVSLATKISDDQPNTKNVANYGKKSSLSSKDVPSTTETKAFVKSPLQPIETNKKIRLEEEEKVPKLKKKRARLQQQSFEKQLPTIVLTSVHSNDQDTIRSIVDQLGKFRCMKTVCESTTHVVCGNPRRTVNILSATLRGCWILSLDWVMKSLECGYWVAEEPYEMTMSFPAGRFYRLLRQTSYIKFQSELFKGCGSIFLSSGTAPPTQQLEGLLHLGGGKVTTSHRKADVYVGCKGWNNAAKSVSEQWILDSISAHTLLPLDDYLLDSPYTREVSPEL